MITKWNEGKPVSYLDQEGQRRGGWLNMQVIEITTPFGSSFRFTKSSHGQTWVDSRDGKRKLPMFVKAELARFEKARPIR